MPFSCCLRCPRCSELCSKDARIPASTKSPLATGYMGAFLLPFSFFTLTQLNPFPFSSLPPSSSLVLLFLVYILTSSPAILRARATRPHPEHQEHIHARLRRTSAALPPIRLPLISFVGHRHTSSPLMPASLMLGVQHAQRLSTRSTSGRGAPCPRPASS
ncbi:hypothetical protein B0H13DRAFT_887749 [Mycena leptocephala]|nr:hypothetical protein B0H13DRAFT_887749 [Mycena leptocephala]